MILVTARIEAHPAGRRELARALLDWAASVRREGSGATNIYEDLEAAAPVFCLVSAWATRSPLEAHLRSPAFSSMLGAVELLADRSTVVVTEAGERWAGATTLRRLRDAGRHSPTHHPERAMTRDGDPDQKSQQ